MLSLISSLAECIVVASVADNGILWASSLILAGSNLPCGRKRRWFYIRWEAKKLATKTVLTFSRLVRKDVLWNWYILAVYRKFVFDENKVGFILSVVDVEMTISVSVKKKLIFRHGTTRKKKKIEETKHGYLYFSDRIHFILW